MSTRDRGHNRDTPSGGAREYTMSLSVSQLGLGKKMKMEAMISTM